MKKNSQKSNQGEKALQISDELFRAIADYTVDWEMWISSDGELLWVNSAVERITGYSVTEVMSMPDLISALVVDEDRPKAKACFQQAIKNGRIEDCDVRCRKKDGSIVCLSVSWQMIKDKCGNSLGLRGSIRDITKRKQAEEVLRSSEEKFRRIMETAHDGIWAMDRNHRTTFVNPRMTEMLGYDQAEIIGRQVEDFMFVEDLPAHQQRMLERHEGEPGIYHHRFRRRDGSEIWVEVSATALSDVNHEFDGSFAMFTDITRHKQAEEALQASEARLAEMNQLLSGILEHTTMMAVFLDSHFNFIWVNRSYAETCKRDQAFFPGKNHFDLYPHAENQQIFQKVVDTGEPFFVAAKPFEFPDQPERGTTYWDWSLVPVKNEREEVTGLVFTLVEVTDQIRDQERQKENQANLQAWFNAIDESVFLCTHDGIVLACNETFATRIGRSPAECIGDSVYDMIPPEVAARRKQFVDRVLQTGSAIEFEDERQGRWIHHRISPVFGPDGSVNRLAIYAQDVTERKKSEEALQRSTELLDSIRRAQSIYIEQGDTSAVFDELLHIIVKMTGSEFGFMDEFLHDENGTPYKVNLALSNISWNNESKALYEQLRSRNLEF